MNIREQVSRSLQELGQTGALFYYLAEFLRRASAGQLRMIRYMIVAQPVAEEPVVKRPDSTTQVRRIEVGDPEVAGFPRPPAVIARRYAAGHVCLRATVEGTFAGFLWLAFDAYEEDEVRCRYQLADSTSLVWDFDVYVEPRFRLGRTFARLWDATNDQLRERGIRWSLSRISAVNPASLAAHSRLGAVPVGHATFVCLGPLQVALLPGRRIPHLSWNQANRPILVLHGPPQASAVKRKA